MYECETQLLEDTGIDAIRVMMLREAEWADRDFTITAPDGEFLRSVESVVPLGGHVVIVYTTGKNQD